MLGNQLDQQSMVSLNQQSEDSVEEEVSRESPASSMMTPELSSDLSLNKSSEMLLHTLNTPEGKLSLLWMLSMRSKDKEELSTVSEADFCDFTLIFISFNSIGGYSPSKNNTINSFI